MRGGPGSPMPPGGPKHTVPPRPGVCGRRPGPKLQLPPPVGTELRAHPFPLLGAQRERQLRSPPVPSGRLKPPGPRPEPCRAPGAGPVGPGCADPTPVAGPPPRAVRAAAATLSLQPRWLHCEGAGRESGEGKAFIFLSPKKAIEKRRLARQALRSPTPQKNTFPRTGAAGSPGSAPGRPRNPGCTAARGRRLRRNLTRPNRIAEMGLRICHISGED